MVHPANLMKSHWLEKVFQTIVRGTTPLRSSSRKATERRLQVYLLQHHSLTSLLRTRSKATRQQIRCSKSSFAMGNDGAEDIPADSARLWRKENKQPQISLYPNQGAFDDAIHMPTPSAYLTPPGLAISNNKLSHPTPIPDNYYFDTYSLVRNISKGGFTDDQSVTIMEAIEHILENNIGFTEQCLTSRYNFDNDSYLFKEACSQLRSSIQSARDLEAERQHASRIQLQHEFNMLSQRLHQEMTEMKDSIRGMLNDHSITIREHQRNIDTLLQEINYKINVSLNGDGKAAIESIRWILTSRAALTVATCALMIVFVLKFYSVRMQDSERNIKNQEENQLKSHVSTEVCKTLFTAIR